MSLSQFRAVDYDAAVVPEDDMDATKAVATALVVRALRAAGMHHVLAGAPCTAVIVGVDASSGQIVADAARDLLKKRGRGRPSFETAVHDHTAPTRRTAWSLERLVDSLQDGTCLFSLHDGADTVPDALALVADGIATLPAADAELIGAEVLGASGKVPSKRELDALVGLPLSLLAIALKTGRSMVRGTALARRVAAARLVEDQAEATSERQVDGLSDGPMLADLHGLGEAGEWGMSLAEDMADYKAGRIGWEDVDRGALVSGPPGTGKSTFARALGRTCGLPVFIHSHARWQATGFLNDLLKAMRAAFTEALAAAPSILFVDEIDALGDRGTTADHNASYDRKVIDAFLECLDGADARAGVVVLGCTNHPSALDPAIRRAGRLDRHLRIPLPDIEARIGIMRWHLRGGLAAADLTSVASLLEGASGADLELAVRDARRRARRARREIVISDLEASLPTRTRMSDELFRRTCVHEGGHFLVGLALAHRTGSVPSLATVSREFSGSSGASTQFIRNGGFDQTRDAYLAEIATLLAGGAAEEVVLGNRGAGSGGQDGSDLQLATKLAVLVEASFGLGDSLLHAAVPDDRDMARVIAFDPKLGAEVRKILASAHEEAKKILGRESIFLEAIAQDLAACGRFPPDDKDPCWSESLRSACQKGGASSRDAIEGGAADRLRRAPPAHGVGAAAEAGRDRGNGTAAAGRAGRPPDRAPEGQAGQSRGEPDLSPSGKNDGG